MKKLVFIISLILLSTYSFATTYYSTGSNDVTSVSSWNSATNGSGSAPTDFTGATDIFVVQGGHSMTTSSAWTVAGSVQISANATLTATSIVSCATFIIDNGGTYVHDAVSGTANGVATDIPGTTTRTFGASSTVEIKKWGNGGTALVGLPTVTWGNLIINVASLAANWVQSNLNFTAVGNVTIKATGGGTYAFKFISSGTLNGIIGGNLNIQGGYVSINQASSGTSVIVLSVSGNYNQTGGSFALNDYAGAAGGTFFTQLSVGGSMSITGGAFCGGGHWDIATTTPPNINYAIYVSGDLTVNGGTFALNRFVSNIRAEYVSIGGNITVGSATTTNFTAPGTWSSGNGGSIFFLAGNNSTTINIDDSNLSTFSITGLSVASGVTSVTVPSGYNILPGMIIYGTGIANPTYITAVSGTTLTLSTATTAAVTEIRFTPGITNAGWVIPAGKTVTLQSNLLSDRLISVGGTLNMGNYTIAGSRVFTALPTANISFTGTIAANDNKLTAASPSLNGLMPGMILSSTGVLADNTVITQTSGAGQVGFCPSANAITASTTGINFTATSAPSTISTAKSNFIQSYNSATQYGGANYTAAIMNKIRYFAQETNLIFNGSSAQTFTSSTSNTSSYRYNGVVTTAVATTLTSSPTLTLATANALIQPGQLVMNSELVVGTVSSVSGTTVTLAANALSAVTNVLLYFVTPTVKNLTVNNVAGLSVKTNLSVGGTLALTSGIINIDSSYTLRITSGNDIAGAPFSASKYIGTNSYTGKSSYGILAIDNINSAKLFPIGTTLSGYLPVTITPSGSSSFSVAALDSVSVDGTRNGTKAYVGDAVNATWKIDRSSGSGTATVALGWPSAIEGTDFAAASNSIGVSNYNGVAYQTAIGSGDNSANTATASFSTFGSSLAFAVVKSGTITLPTQLISFTGSLMSSNVQLNWVTAKEVNINSYSVEKSYDGVTFSSIGNLAAKNGLIYNNYALVDANAKSGNNYYRLRIISSDGKTSFSNVVVINVRGNNAINFSFFPNPVKNTLTVTHPKVDELSTIQIFSVDGRLLQTKQLGVGSTQTSFDVSSLISGKYMITYRSGNVVNTLILVK